MNNNGGAQVLKAGETLTAISKGKGGKGRKNLSGLAGALSSILPGPSKGSQRFGGLLTRLKGRLTDPGGQATHRRTVAGSGLPPTSGKPVVRGATAGSNRPGKAKAASQSPSEAGLLIQTLEEVARSVPLSGQPGIHSVASAAMGASPAGSSATASEQPGSPNGKPTPGAHTKETTVTLGRPSQVRIHPSAGALDPQKPAIRQSQPKSPTAQQRSVEPAEVTGQRSLAGIRQPAGSIATRPSRAAQVRHRQGVISDSDVAPSVERAPPTGTKVAHPVRSAVASRGQIRLAPRRANGAPSVAHAQPNAVVTGTEPRGTIRAARKLANGSTLDKGPRTRLLAAEPPLQNGIRPLNEPGRSVTASAVPQRSPAPPVWRIEQSNPTGPAQIEIRSSDSHKANRVSVTPDVRTRSLKRATSHPAGRLRRLRAGPAVRPVVTQTRAPAHSPHQGRQPGIQTVGTAPQPASQPTVVARPNSVVASGNRPDFGQRPTVPAKGPRLQTSVTNATVAVKATARQNDVQLVPKLAGNQSPPGKQLIVNQRTRLVPARPVPAAGRRTLSAEPHSAAVPSGKPVIVAAKPTAHSGGSLSGLRPAGSAPQRVDQPITGVQVRSNPTQPAVSTRDQARPARSIQAAGRAQSAEPQSAAVPSGKPAIVAAKPTAHSAGSLAGHRLPESAPPGGKLNPPEAQLAASRPRHNTDHSAPEAPPANRGRPTAEQPGLNQARPVLNIRREASTTQPARVEQPSGNPTALAMANAGTKSTSVGEDTATVMKQNNAELQPVMAQRPIAQVNRRKQTAERSRSGITRSSSRGVFTPAMRSVSAEQLPGAATQRDTGNSYRPANSLAGNEQQHSSGPATVSELGNFAGQVKIRLEGHSEHGGNEPAMPVTTTTTTPAPRVQLQQPVQTAQFARLTAQQYQRFTQGGQTGHEYSFNAGSLGNVRVTFTEGAAGTTLHILVESSQAQQQLQRALPTVQDQFVGLGLNFADVDVEVGDTGSDSRFTKRHRRDRSVALSNGAEESAPVELVAGIRNFGYNTVEFVA